METRTEGKGDGVLILAREETMVAFSVAEVRWSTNPSLGGTCSSGDINSPSFREIACGAVEIRHLEIR